MTVKKKMKDGVNYDIEIRKTEKKGMGVFALRPFKKGEIIEKCPVIIFSQEESEHIEQTPLKDYWYSWNSEDPSHYGAMACGYGCFYNHSSDPNANAERDYENKLLVYRAIKDIPAETEITIRYMTVWFEEEK